MEMACSSFVIYFLMNAFSYCSSDGLLHELGPDLRWIRSLEANMLVLRDRGEPSAFTECGRDSREHHHGCRQSGSIKMWCNCCRVLPCFYVDVRYSCSIRNKQLTYRTSGTYFFCAGSNRWKSRCDMQSLLYFSADTGVVLIWGLGLRPLLDSDNASKSQRQLVFVSHVRHFLSYSYPRHFHLHFHLHRFTKKNKWE